MERTCEWRTTPGDFLLVPAILDIIAVRTVSAQGPVATMLNAVRPGSPTKHLLQISQPARACSPRRTYQGNKNNSREDKVVQAKRMECSIWYTPRSGTAAARGAVEWPTSSLLTDCWHQPTHASKRRSQSTTLLVALATEL